MSVATDIDRLVAREHHDPHSLLGAHESQGGVTIRALRPMAEAVTVQPAGVELARVHPSGLFEGVVSGAALPLRWGRLPPSAARRSSRWRISAVSGAGRTNALAWTCSSVSGRSKRSRNVRRTSSLIFFC